LHLRVAHQGAWDALFAARGREGRKKQNLKCVRYDVDGECRVLLVANRGIPKGERLYYDYNGSEHEYPTHHFV
jgi:[histone H3]-lysine27 N-methyltransferase